MQTEIKRNLKNFNNKTGKRIIDDLKEIISTHEKYKKCYFWTHTGNAANRRRNEFGNDVSFFLDGKKYTIAQELTISCKNFYYSCDIRVDGIKKNITCLKKLVQA